MVAAFGQGRAISPLGNRAVGTPHARRRVLFSPDPRVRGVFGVAEVGESGATPFAVERLAGFLDSRADGVGAQADAVLVTATFPQHPFDTHEFGTAVELAPPRLAF